MKSINFAAPTATKHGVMVWYPSGIGWTAMMTPSGCG
jgi:hypothetical protein